MQESLRTIHKTQLLWIYAANFLYFTLESSQTIYETQAEIIYELHDYEWLHGW